jgi:UDP-N-acetylglucosamine acyltransferase
VSIHPTAIVDPGARLGAGVSVGPYAVIEAETQIGEGSEIRAHAVVKRYTRLGRENVVHEGAVLGGEPQDLSYDGGPSGLLLGDRNVIREFVTIHRGSGPNSPTVVGSGCFLMACAHVAHDDRLGDGVILANSVLLAGHVEVADRAFLSGGVVVHQFCRVGRLSIAGGNSRIIMDALPFVNTTGIPARAVGLNLVGLRRAGIGADDRRVLKEAYRLLLRSNLTLATAVEAMTRMAHPLVDELVRFVGASKRGFHRAGPAREGETE